MTTTWNPLNPAHIMDNARVHATKSNPAHRIVANAITAGELTLMDVVAVETKQPKRFHLFAELVSYVLMDV